MQKISLHFNSQAFTHSEPSEKYLWMETKGVTPVHKILF